LLILLILIAAAPGFAQSPISLIDSLVIEIWPDYDKASVLVLLTGTLAGDTPLPATVTLPLPEAAQLNAVARIDSQGGDMRDDISWNTDSPDTLTLITPELRFRVEYYFPYKVDKNQHTFDYTWLTAFSVNNFQLWVQRPISAIMLKTEPATVKVATRGDGFEYYTFPAQAVPAGQSISIRVTYEMSSDQLSLASIPSANSGTQPSVKQAAPAAGIRFSWALAAVAAGAVIIIGALIWHIASRRRSPDIHNHPEPRAEKRSEPSRFCSNCGEPIGKGDKFCRECGSEL
jgi:hypothetical protein